MPRLGRSLKRASSASTTRIPAFSIKRMLGIPNWTVESRSISRICSAVSIFITTDYTDLADYADLADSSPKNPRNPCNPRNPWLLLVLDHFGEIGQKLVHRNKGSRNAPPDDFAVLIDQEIVTVRSFGLLVLRAEPLDNGRIDIAQERVLGTNGFLELLL